MNDEPPRRRGYQDQKEHQITMVKNARYRLPIKYKGRKRHFHYFHCFKEISKVFWFFIQDVKFPSQTTDGIFLSKITVGFIFSIENNVTTMNKKQKQTNIIAYLLHRTGRATFIHTIFINLELDWIYCAAGINIYLCVINMHV